MPGGSSKNNILYVKSAKVNELRRHGQRDSDPLVRGAVLMRTQFWGWAMRFSEGETSRWRGSHHVQKTAGMKKAKKEACVRRGLGRERCAVGHVSVFPSTRRWCGTQEVPTPC